MQRIVVATDFSTRSDRALRRAVLLARQASAELVVVNVVDDDQPPRMVAVERREAAAMLDDLARTMRESDGVACEARVALGDPFQAVVRTADDVDADLVVMGPHRRQVLRDVFVGTTVERTIRASRRPVLKANAVPAKPYARVLLAIDFSDCSARAVEATRALGFLDGVETIALHAFDAPAQTLMLRASTSTQRLKDYIAERQEQAGAKMKAFLTQIGFSPTRRVLQLVESSLADAIHNSARKVRADLVVVGTHGRTGMGRLLLGSVAEAILRDAEMDVLAVPCVEGAARTPGC